MPIARFQMPDGRIGRFEVPDGTTAEQAPLLIEQHIKSQQEQTPALPVEQQQVDQSAQQNPELVGHPVLRQVGLATRYGIEGIASPVTAVGDIANIAINKTTGSNLQMPSDLLSKGLTAVGLPEPQTPTERVVGDVSRSIAGTGGVIKAGKEIATALPKISEFLVANPLTQLGAATGSAAASGTAREAGLGSTGQTLAGLVGGIAGGAAGIRSERPPKPASPALLSDVEQSGVGTTEAIGNLRGQLEKEAKKQQAKTDLLFEAAKKEGSKAFVDLDKAKQFSNEIKQMASTEIDDAAKSTLSNAANRIDSLIESGIIPVNDFEALRRTASNAGKKAGGGSGFAGRAISNKIDDFLQSALETGGVSGDTKAVTTWKNAIQNRRDYAVKFEEPAAIAATLEDDTIETIGQKFLGGAGPVRKEASKIYDNTLAALPENQRKNAGFLFRQSVVNKMVTSAARAVNQPNSVSANNMANQIKILRTENRSLWDKFTPNEKSMLSDLEGSLRKEASGGWVTKVGNVVTKMIRKSGVNVELPRTLAAKTAMTVDQLVDLTKVRPKKLISTKASIGLGTIVGNSSSKENK